MATLIKTCNAEDNWNSVQDFAPISCPIVPSVSPYPYSFTINTNPAFVASGTKSYRTELRDLDLACNGNVRAEMIYIQDSNSSGPISRFNIEIWVGYTMFVPSDYPNRSSQYPGKIVYQYQHGVPEVHAIIYVDTNPLLMRWILTRRTSSSATRTSGTIGSVNLIRGNRYDFVYRHVRRLDSSGSFQLWVNGVSAITYNGYTAFDGDANNYTNNCQIKNGLYGGELFNGESFVLYYDNFKVATGTDGFSLVDPSGGGSQTFSVDAGGDYSGTAGEPIQLNGTVIPA